MDIAILKGELNYRYSNNATCIALNIQDTVINVEENY